MTRRNDAPPLFLYLTEPYRAVVDLGLFLASQPLQRHLPVGERHPVLVLPGLMADDASTRPLRGVLRRLGYPVHGWHLGRNVGPTEVCVNGMRQRLEDLQTRYGQPVSIIGWSLGGIFARRLARRTPDSVRQVITLGSPFRLARPSQSYVTSTYQRFAHLHVENTQLPLEEGEPALRVPATSIYSQSDGVVAWEACLNPPGEQSENIAVVASHLGIGHHPAAIWAIADRLAQPRGTWAPFRAPAWLRGAFPKTGTAGSGQPAAA